MEDLKQKLQPKYDHHRQICSDLNGLYERKNTDYGDSFGQSLRHRGGWLQHLSEWMTSTSASILS